jgi:hypothetical protein
MSLICRGFYLCLNFFYGRGEGGGAEISASMLLWYNFMYTPLHGTMKAVSA